MGRAPVTLEDVAEAIYSLERSVRELMDVTGRSSLPGRSCERCAPRSGTHEMKPAIRICPRTGETICQTCYEKETHNHVWLGYYVADSKWTERCGCGAQKETADE